VWDTVIELIYVVHCRRTSLACEFTHLGSYSGVHPSRCHLLQLQTKNPLVMFLVMHTFSVDYVYADTVGPCVISPNLPAFLKVGKGTGEKDPTPLVQIMKSGTESAQHA